MSGRATFRKADRAIVAIGLALCAVFGAMVLAVPPASAEIDGPCTAVLAGADVSSLDSGSRSDDIAVAEDERVSVDFASSAGFVSHKIQLEFAGFRWTVSEDTDDGSQAFSDTVNVDDYATYGVGLYKVIGVATLSDGTKCSGAATVDVGGNPLTTVAGAAAAATVAVGTAGAAFGTVASARSSDGGLGPLKEMVEDSFREARREVEAESARDEAARTIDDFVVGDTPFIPSIFGCLGALVFAIITLPFRLPFMAISSGNGGGAPSSPSPRKAPRARWTPRITLLGLLSGFLAAAGLVVLLQQYSIAYPTRALVIEVLVAGLLLYGLVLPTIGRTIAVTRVNSKLARLEERAGR